MPNHLKAQNDVAVAGRAVVGLLAIGIAAVEQIKEQAGLKLLYNERSLGIYLKETKDLVQIARGSIIEIHNFFFED
tara:strand:+ start:242 stop:469 length:228 start_codon:yes stop_codon:yes gene_type:complete